MNSQGCNFEEFSPKDMRKDTTVLIVAARNSGKSVLMRDLLYHTRDNYDVAIAFTKTMSTVLEFRKFLPPDLVHGDGYDHEVANAFVQTCVDNSKKQRVRHSAIILDDCGYDKSVLKSDTFALLAYNGRHMNVTIFVVVQYSMSVPAALRGNFDYVCALKDSNFSNRKRLFDHFFGVFPNFKGFEAAFQQITDDFGVMVLDRTSSSTELRENIKFYRAQLELPSFKICKPVFWQLSGLVSEMRKAKARRTPGKNKKTLRVDF